MIFVQRISFLFKANNILKNILTKETYGGIFKIVLALNKIEC